MSIELPSEATRAWYRRPWVVALAAVVVLALVAGVGAVVWLTRPNRAAFDEAVADLAAAPVLHYRTTVAGSDVDVRVTGGGDMIGTITLLGVKLEVLTLDGTTYVKAPAGALSGTTAPAAVGRWITGGPLSATAEAWRAFGPLSLSGRLFEGLTEAKFPGRLDGDSKLDGVAVLKASLPDGDLYVTKAAPHRVVRYTAKGAPATGPSGLPSLPKLPSLPPPPSRRGLPSLPALPSLLRGILLEELRAPTVPPGGGSSFDLDPVTQTDLEHAFQDLQDNARDLASAIDATVQFTVQGNANVACSPAGCVVTATVTNQVTGTGKTKVTGAQVTAEMTATVFLNGRSAGSCVSPPTPVPTGGTGTLTCDVVSAGAVYAAIVQQASASGKGGVVIITATGSAEVVAMANVQAQVEQQVRRVDRERRLSLRGPPGTLRTPTVGDRDGGPGEWVTKTPTGSAASQAYQERATGVVRGYEYKVGNRHFDGFENGVLIDGKDKYKQFVDKSAGDWQDWWKRVKPKSPNRPAGYTALINEARGQVAEAGGLPIEWRASDPQFAALLTRTFENEGIPIRVRYFP